MKSNDGVTGWKISTDKQEVGAFGEQERMDLGTCCLILSCSIWEVRPTYSSHFAKGFQKLKFLF